MFSGLGSFVLLILFVFVPLVLSDPTSSHFFTQDDCQYFKIVNQQQNYVEKLWFVREKDGIILKQGYKKNSENTFFNTWNLVQNTQTQINKHPENILLCKTQNLTDQQRQSMVIVQEKWQSMLKNQKYLGTSDGGKQKFLFEGISFLGSGYTDVKYIEKDGQPIMFKFLDSKGAVVKEMSVANFSTNCKQVKKGYENDEKKCKESADAGNGFPDTPEKRAMTSVRIPTSEIDPSDPRFRTYALPQIDSIMESRSTCSISVAYAAMGRAKSAGAQYGNWCGVGGDKGVCCQTVCPDGGYDVLCRKHDSSSYWEKMVNATISPCSVDIDFLNASKQFNGCIGDENSPWRHPTDPTGKVTCEETKKAAINTFTCWPCLNYECKDDVWDFGSWRYVTECNWDTYWTSYPKTISCNGNCWDQSMEPWGYSHYYQTPC